MIGMEGVNVSVLSWLSHEQERCFCLHSLTILRVNGDVYCIHWASESHPTPPEVQIHAVGLGCWEVYHG